MVEIVLALGILTLLVTITLTYYSDMQVTAQHQAAQSELDAIKNDIHRQQLERRTAYTSRIPPPGRDMQDHRDPWGQAFIVDPEKHVIYSIGPNGQDDHGTGDDITMAFDAYAFNELAPPAGFRAAEHGVDWVQLAWNPVTYAPGVAGYNVYRRESEAASAFTTVPLNAYPIPDSLTPNYRDETISAGRVYYYSLEVLTRDGQRTSVHSPLGFTIPTAR